MMKFWNLWSMSVREMASSPNSSFWRSWKWMVRTPTLCLCSWKRSCLNPVMTLCPWWVIPNSSSGVPWTGMTSPGTLRSSSLARTGNRSSGTAEGSSPATLKQISKSFSRGRSKSGRQPSSVWQRKIDRPLPITWSHKIVVWYKPTVQTWLKCDCFLDFLLNEDAS